MQLLEFVTQQLGCILYSDMYDRASVPKMLQDECSSFDIALQVGKKINSLQVATCQASCEKDKKLDFHHMSFLVRIEDAF